MIFCNFNIVSTSVYFYVLDLSSGKRSFQHLKITKLQAFKTLFINASLRVFTRMCNAAQPSLFLPMIFLHKSKNFANLKYITWWKIKRFIIILEVIFYDTNVHFLIEKKVQRFIVPTQPPPNLCKKANLCFLHYVLVNYLTLLMYIYSYPF